MTSTPYATVIIPTHDRDATLHYSVMSAQRQSVRDIEILVVGDGCTPEVRLVAQRLASSDPRVRFHDLPKAPLRGAANRDLAVRSAASERIFYNDDDDLLLPRHVELLGSQLDKFDVVDTPVASVQLDGRVAIGLHDSAHRIFASMLAAEKYKAVFDTHLAHRRSAYLGRSGPWSTADDRRVVLHMLKRFAEQPSARWATINHVSALSFHGMARATVPNDIRAAELARWCQRTNDPDSGRQILREATYSFHALRLMRALTQIARTEAESAIFHLMDRVLSEGAATPRQIEEIEFARRLAFSETPDHSFGAEFLESVLDGSLGPAYQAINIVSLLAKTVRADVISLWLDACTDRPSARLARFHLKAVSRSLSEVDFVEARRGMEREEPWRRHFFGLSLIESLITAGRIDCAWNLSETMSSTVPKSRHAEAYWRARERIARRLGNESGAAEAQAAIATASAEMT